jgi:hypothetical protein
MTAVAQIMSRLEAFNVEENRRTRNIIVQRRERDPKTPSIKAITASVEFLAVPLREEHVLRATVHKTILDNLGYPAMPKRYETVVDAHPDTFEWAFEESLNDGRPWTNLAAWLKAGNGLYWIAGKPGSGKSTLMKHIFDDDRTRLYLQRWAQIGESKNVPLVIASFFFWNSGTLEQRSQIGMLRSLLFQVLEQKPDLIPIVFPLLWAKQYGKWLADGISVWSESWTLRTLLSAFRRLVTQREIHIKLFFLIDGLDEFDGNHEVLAEAFNEIAVTSTSVKNHWIKCCVSSRPWVVFKENFEGCPNLQLQDLTYDDIQKFVTGSFLANSAFRRLSLQDPLPMTELIEEVVTKAEGVFLWVQIVVRDLLKGIRNRDSVPDLWERVVSFPREIEPLYRHIISQIDERYLLWASKAFQIVRASREIIMPKVFDIGKDDSGQNFISAAELYFALDESLTHRAMDLISQEALDIKCRQTAFQVSARCACLLEVVNPKGESKVTYQSQVQYLHRTARDFLEARDRWDEVLDRTRGVLFDPHWRMMRCKSLMFNHEWISGRLKRPHVRDTIIAILSFASKADAHSPSHAQQLRLLDDANKAMEKHKLELDKSHSALKKLPIPESSQKAIMICALSLNLSAYITRELRNLSGQDPVAAKSTASYMLRRQVHCNRRCLNKGFPPLNLRLASTLINFGADVNYTCTDFSKRTSWEDFLDQGLDNLESQDEYPYPDFANLLKLFLSSGANPGVHISDNRLRILDFFESYVRPAYLNEAEGLHVEIINALRRVAPVPTNVRQENPVLEASIGIARPPHLTPEPVETPPLFTMDDLDPLDDDPTTPDSRALDKPHKSRWWTKILILHAKAK